MKKLHLCLILLCFVLPLRAQTPFQKSLPAYLDTAMIRAAPDGQSVYVVGMNKANGSTRISIMRMSGNGQMLWQRDYFAGGNSLSAKSIETVRDGLLVLVADNPNAAQANGFLMKLNTDGRFVWSRQLGEKNITRVSEIQKDDAENIWLCGERLRHVPTDSAYSFLMQLDRNGSVLYGRKNMHHYFPNNLDEVYNVTDLIWNPHISALFMVEDFEVPYSYSAISQPNRGRYALGSCNSNREPAEWLIGFQFERLAMTKSHIAVGGWISNVSVFQRDKPAICLIDSSGQNVTHIKTTQTVQQPIHSQNGDILFYEPTAKILTKYDTSLTAIWTKKFDNCYETKAFSADIGIDGSIYTIRNINAKTIISRILSSGSLSVCNDYNKASVPIVDFENRIISSLSVFGFYSLHFPMTDSLLTFSSVNTTTNDYCFKLDAAFDLPDTICLGMTLKPKNVDTTAYLRHDWLILSQWTQKVQPTIDFTSAGRYRIYHSVQNDICTDTTSRYVTVVLTPKITLNDTVVCGSKKIAVNLTDKNASRYFLNGVATSPVFDISLNDTYTLRAENPSCRAEKSIKVKIVDFPSPLKSVDSIYCQGSPFPVVLTGGFENIFWDNKAVKDTFIISDGSKHAYRATYSIDKDCVVKGEFSVLRKNCGSTLTDIVYVPNAFSPNDDGTNDVFQAYPTKDAEILSLMIYDRWGSLVFQSSNMVKTWDGVVNGKALTPDVFIYMVQYRDKRTNKVQILSGDLTLMR